MEYNKNMVSMTLREVKYLSDNGEFNSLVNKYNLKVKIVDNEKLYLISPCFVFEIHGLVVEDFFYFDLYSKDLNLYSNLDRILADFNSEKLGAVYKEHVNKRKNILIPQLQGNAESTLKAEQYFFAMLQLMDDLVSDIMQCKKEIGLEYWSEIFDYKKQELIRILQEE
jgi:hypothetical protein